VLSLNNLPDNEINKMTYENATPLVLVRPVHPHHSRTGDRRRAAQGHRGHDVSIQALSNYKKGERDDKAFMQMSNVGN